jgi:hypothetical protein
MEDTEDKPILPLHELDKRHPGLTVHVAGSYVEAARVSLHENHQSPQNFELSKDSDQTVAVVKWEPPDERCLKAWANRDDATRDGAYACAIAAVELKWGLVAMRRAETLTGSDYYVAIPSVSQEDLEDHVRLEISGTQSDDIEVRRRLSEKIRQAKMGKSSLPAIAAVVGFKVKNIAMRSVS